MSHSIHAVTITTGLIVGLMSAQNNAPMRPTPSDSVVKAVPKNLTCGPSCLYVFLERKGALIPEPYCPRSNGWTLVDVADVARVLGLSAQPIRCSAHFVRERLIDRNSGVILHVDGGHYVLLRRCENQITVFDPALSVETPTSLRECLSRYDWDGYAVILDRV